MTANTRQHPRAKVRASCTFGMTEDAPRSATVTSLSARGCFVSTRAMATPGQRMFLKLWLPERRWLSLAGEVLYPHGGVGFGLSSPGPTAEEQEAINAVIAEEAGRARDVRGGEGGDG